MGERQECCLVEHAAALLLLHVWALVSFKKKEGVLWKNPFQFPTMLK